MTYSHNQHIGVYENAVPPDFCDYLINLASKEKMTARPPQEANNLEKKDFAAHVFNFKEDLSFPIHSFLKKCMDIYVTEYSYLINYFPLIPTGYKFQTTYPSGGYHIWHAESVGFRLRNRVAVWTLYLNDIEEGGETEFLYQSIRVSPKKGTICIFPSQFTHLHRGNPPLSKTKHIVTGWIEYEDKANQRHLPNLLPPFELQ